MFLKTNDKQNPVWEAIQMLFIGISQTVFEDKLKLL